MNRRKHWCPCCGREISDGCVPGCVVGMPALQPSQATLAYAAEHGLDIVTAHAELSALRERGAR